MLQHLSLQQLELLYTKKKRQQKYHSAELQISAQELKEFNNKQQEDAQLTIDQENQEEDEEQENQDHINLLHEDQVNYTYENPSKKRLIIIGMAFVQCCLITILNFMGIYLYGSELYSLMFLAALLAYFVKILLIWISNRQRGSFLTQSQALSFILGIQIGMITTIIINFENEPFIINCLVGYIPCTIMNIFFMYFYQKYKVVL